MAKRTKNLLIEVAMYVVSDEVVKFKPTKKELADAKARHNELARKIRDTLDAADLHTVGFNYIGVTDGWSDNGESIADFDYAERPAATPAVDPVVETPAPEPAAEVVEDAGFIGSGFPVEEWSDDEIKTQATDWEVEIPKGRGWRNKLVKALTLAYAESD